MARGTARDGKAGTPHPKRPPLVRPGSDFAWAEAELERIDPLIKQGEAALERRLEAACGENGDTAEILRILRHLEDRQERALRVAAQRDAHAATGLAEEERARFLAPFRGPDVEPDSTRR